MHLDDGQFTQNRDGEAIGYEVADPEPWSGYTNFGGFGRLCNGCRAADIQVSEYYSNISSAQGELARVWPEPWSDPLLIHDPPKKISEKWPLADVLAGYFVTKVGRKTGTTAGNILRTCVDFDFGYAVKICQFEAEYYSEGGDSGAPVYVGNFLGDLEGIAGIHNGRVAGNAVFSSVDGLEYDMGQTIDFQICYPGYGC